MAGRRYLDSQWPHLPNLDSRIELGFMGTYVARDFERIARGFKSSDLNEKWNIIYTAPWLTFHRSWTGLGVYGIRFDRERDARVAESWINGDIHTCNQESLEYHRRLVTFLIDALLLIKPAKS